MGSHTSLFLSSGWLKDKGTRWRQASREERNSPQSEGEWGLPGSSELACLNWNMVLAQTEKHSYG